MLLTTAQIFVQSYLDLLLTLIFNLIYIIGFSPLIPEYDLMQALIEAKNLNLL